MKVKVYVDEYDVQGDDQDIPDQMSKDEWSNLKQSLISDFIVKFGDIVKNKGIMLGKNHDHLTKMDLTTFGQGVYTNNEMNRRLGRVGQSYDKSFGLRTKLLNLLHDRNVSIKGQPEFTDRINKRWSIDENAMVTDLKSKGLKAKQIAPRVLRTVNAVYKSKGWKLEIG